MEVYTFSHSFLSFFISIIHLINLVNFLKKKKKNELLSSGFKEFSTVLSHIFFHAWNITNIVILVVNYRSTHRSTANLTINFVQYTSMHTNITTYWKKDLIGEKKLGNSHLRNIPPRRPWIQAGIFADRENSRPEHGAACQEATRSLAKTAAGRKGPATNDKMTNELLKRQWKIKGGWGGRLLSRWRRTRSKGIV